MQERASSSRRGLQEALHPPSHSVRRAAPTFRAPVLRPTKALMEAAHSLRLHALPIGQCLKRCQSSAKPFVARETLLHGPRSSSPSSGQVGVVRALQAAVVEPSTRHRLCARPAPTYLCLPRQQHLSARASTTAQAGRDRSAEEDARVALDCSGEARRREHLCCSVVTVNSSPVQRQPLEELTGCSTGCPFRCSAMQLQPASGKAVRMHHLEQRSARSAIGCAEHVPLKRYPEHLVKAQA